MLHGETVRTNFNLIRKRSFYFVTTKCLTHFFQVLIAKYKLCKYKTLGTHLLLLPSYQIIRHKMILQNNLSRRENISNLTSAGRLTRWKPRAMFQMTSPPPILDLIIQYCSIAPPLIAIHNGPQSLPLPPLF